MSRFASSLSALGLAAALALALLSLSASEASAAPAFRLGSVSCVDGQMRVSPPPFMDSSFHTDLRDPELVEWSPDLYRWAGRRRGWRRVVSAPWYMAYTSDYGYFHFQYRGSWLAPSNNGISFVPYNINRAGRYRIKHHLFWAEASRETGGLGINAARWSRTCVYT